MGDFNDPQAYVDPAHRISWPAKPSAQPAPTQSSDDSGGGGGGNWLGISGGHQRMGNNTIGIPDPANQNAFQLHGRMGDPYGWDFPGSYQEPTQTPAITPEEAQRQAQQAQIKAQQDQANIAAGNAIYDLTAAQQSADAAALSNQQMPTPPTTGQPATPGMMANASPVASRGVSISSPAQKMQAAGGMMPYAAAGRINRAGPSPQTGMVNSAMPSQEQPLKFGGA